MTQPAVTPQNTADFLTIGKGEVWFAPYKTGTTVEDGFQFIGNCPGLTLNAEEETLDHQSSLRGVRNVDKTVTLEKSVSGNLVTDTISIGNIARFFGGTPVTTSQISTTSTVTTIVGARKGREYQLGVTTNRPTGLRKVSSVVVVNGATTYTVNTDYTVDADAGTIFIVSGGTVPDGSADLTVTFNSAAYTIAQMAGQNATVEGALKFKAFNPAGYPIDYYMPYVKMTPGADMSLISEEWTDITYTLDVLKKGDLAFVYADGRAVTS